MKNLYLILFATFLSTTILAQKYTNCYKEYKTVFENRGAFEVNDGVHDNVILVLIGDETTECFVTTVTIKNSNIVNIAIYFEDGTKEIVKYDFNDNLSWTINNGISRTRITSDGTKLILMFTDKIKPKKKKYKKAPLPKFELND